MNKNTEIFKSQSIIRCVIGTEGEYFPEMGNLQNAFCDGLFFACYEGKKRISNDTIQKYTKGTAPFPRKIIKEYLGRNGEKNMRQGIARLVDACMCTSRLRQIQQNVHTNIMNCDAMGENALERISSYYIKENVSREQIIDYLSCVMYCVLQAM